MTATIAQLDVFGPERCRPMSVAEARAWCEALARNQYENFSVLSALVPRDLRPDFAAIYAFCRWADDLGDEVQDVERAAKLLAWWRVELQQCFAGDPRHPVFVALRPTIQRHALPIKPFEDLIAAFQQDQVLTRYQTWMQLMEYCHRSANPVGRLVLMVLGEPREEEVFSLSDSICTALQLTNHWQDVRRDFTDRNRIYIPREMNSIRDFEQRLAATAAQGFAADHEFLDETRRLIRACVDKTWPLFERGQGLLDRLGARSRPIVWLFSAGGQHVLRQIEMWNHETVLHRPTLGAGARFALITRAWLMFRLRKTPRSARP